ncbi:short transient receptor potential channel 4-like [Anticarsia gemmatalis]|uniref:short transient receptor potential channel 4-like n=1 Tax=Anticarsia gemmatalis TaxID=129554 RepID=UPI003F7577A2
MSSFQSHIDKYTVASPTSNPTESIENERLPSLPVQEEKSTKQNSNQIAAELNEHEEIPSYQRVAAATYFQELNTYHAQRKAISVPKIYHHRPLQSTKASNIINKSSSPYIKRGKPLSVNRLKLSRHRSRSYDKLDSSNEEEEVNELKPKEFIHLPKLQPKERDFLQLVSENDVEAVQQYLQENPTLNINCINFQGVSAIHIAVKNRSEAMVEFLLTFPNLEIGDSVLHAVRDNSIKILVMLLDAQLKISPGLECAGTTHSADFPVHVTPLVLAAQMGHYEIVTLLIERGHTIARPHLPNCPCNTCRNSQIKDDALHISSARLSVYRAIASPAYLVHVSSDPILTAFRLTAELAANAAANRQLAAAYLQLADDVSAFAVDLIGCCRTSEEVEIILKQTTGCKSRRHFVLPRLLMALDCKQKEFVAHPNTQQVLESYWLGDWHDWRSKAVLTKAWIILMRVLITPIILLVCMIAPRHRLVTHWQIPLNKLITHISAYFVFLALVFYISNQDKSGQKRGPPNTGAEGPLILYVCGYTWSAIRMCLMQGPRRYFTKLWNWAEIIMLSLFGLTFVFWVDAACDIAANDDENLERKYWNQHDPTLLAEGTFCLATIFAFFRLMFLCQLNYHLGPLQVSLGKMTIDIYKYIIVFAIIISAFAAGLARFYQYYDGMVYEDEFGMKTVQVSSFTSLSDTLNTLFWSLFCMAPLESADVVLENTRDPKQLDKSHENRHAFTERIGYFCFGCFEVISVIVVLNMLIATMSNTFQRVNDNVDIEWTFGKTEVYIDYMLQTTLPSPFNMIPTASGLGSAIEWMWIKLRSPTGVYAKWSLPYCCYIERDVEASVQRDYPALMSVLVQRYFRDKSTSKIYLICHHCGK